MVRKFIISDIHGLGSLYYSVMNYLDNLNEECDVELYINGDLIDRGLESAVILLDVIDRIKENKFKIVYLGGNHELMMYQTYLDRQKGIFNDNNWYINGGRITDNLLLNNINYNEEKLNEIIDFISNLDIYHKFDEKLNDKNIVMVHAKCPNIVKDKCDLKIKDDNKIIQPLLWTRREDYYLIKPNTVGHQDYFTIIGHTPVSERYGYEYDFYGNVLNIDGGCAMYDCGVLSFNHFPLVEVNNEYLKILTFNVNNEIIYGTYFFKNNFLFLSESELNEERRHLNKEYNPKILSYVKKASY